VSSREAAGRVRAAADLGPRRTLTGDPLPPWFPAAETFLVEHAAHLDPAQLGHAATRLADTLNPDGTHTDDAERQRRRELTLHTNRDGTGHAGTSRGTQLSIPNLLRLAAEADIIPVVLNDAGGILAYGRTRRLATRAQRLALTARDRGCSFPGCDRPPTWCQAHHITPWQHGGHTDVDCLTLLCGHHHREFDKQGWTCVMLDGIPHWKPPTWLDPTQTPRRNTTHHVEITFGPHEPSHATTDQALIGAPP